MRKRIITFAAVATIAVVLTACGSAQVSNNPTPTVEPTKAVEATTAPTAEPTATSTPIPTNTPVPTATSTPIPTNTPVPTATSTPTPEPTEEPTPEPTEEPTPEPTATPVPTATPTPEPTATPVPTEAPKTSKAFPHTVTYMLTNSNEYNKFGERTVTFNSMTDIKDYIAHYMYDAYTWEDGYDENGEWVGSGYMDWGYKDIENFLSAFDNKFFAITVEDNFGVAAKEITELGMTVDEFERKVLGGITTSLKFTEEDGFVEVPVTATGEYYVRTFTDLTTGESFIWDIEVHLAENDVPDSYIINHWYNIDELLN